jgi:hypothetical protein
MRTSIGPSTFSGLVGAAAGLWLCGTGAAWAGDGGDLASLNKLLNTPTTGLCAIFGMSSCPQLPTVTQAVLEVVGLGNNVPEMVRAQNSIPPGSAVTAGNPAAVPPPSPGSLTPLPLTSTTTPTVSQFLSTLTPLAFVSQSSGTGLATQLYDPNADSFLYAVGVSSFGFVGSTGLTDPDMVYFFYEDLFRTNTNFATGTVVARFSFPLTVLNTNGTERAVPTTLNFTATNAGDCSMSTVVGDFNGSGMPQTLNPPSAIGIDCAVVFSGSPTSASSHAIFEVAVPLLVTGASPPPNTDPAYFYTLHTNPPKANPVNTGVYTAFLFNDANGLLQGASIGLAPTAAPLCSTLFPKNMGTCPNPIPTPIPFSLCASLPVNTNGSGAKLRPAVGAYYAMATSAEMLLSAPLGSASTSACSPL